MKTAFLFSAVLACFLINNSCFAGDEERINEFLSNINKVNRYEQKYEAINQVASFAPGRDVIMRKYKMYMKGDKALLVLTSPEKEKGKKILMIDHDLWFYFPKTHKSIIINASTIVIGVVNVGDLLVRALDMYKYDHYEKTTSESNADYLITLKAKDNRSPYGRLVYLVRGDKLVSVEAYARSGIKLKKITFVEYITSPDGYKYPVKTKIEDSLQKGYYSLVYVSSLNVNNDIPDYYFNPEHLDELYD